MLEVATFYRFVRLADPKGACDDLVAAGEALAIKGLVLIAEQGVNATIAGDKDKVDRFIALIEGLMDAPFDNVKRSQSFKVPFRRFRVRLEKELITFGQEEADPSRAQTGRYVKPSDWNAVIERNDVVLIDTRNDYETRTGSFEGAIDPNIESFSEFAAYVHEHLDPEENPKVAMFCTGGIRCEVASSYLLQQGFDEVFHLEGGILKYLEEVPVEQSKWRGECFVFDDRVTVDHALAPGQYTLCVACSWPTPRDDVQNGIFEGGAACAHCEPTLTPAHRARAKERWRQRQQKNAAQQASMSEGKQEGTS